MSRRASLSRPRSGRELAYRWLKEVESNMSVKKGGAQRRNVQAWRIHLRLRATHRRLKRLVIFELNQQEVEFSRPYGESVGPQRPDRPFKDEGGVARPGQQLRAGHGFVRGCGILSPEVSRTPGPSGWDKLDGPVSWLSPCDQGEGGEG